MYSIPDAERLNSALLAEITARQAVDPGVFRSNRKGWHSKSDFFLRQEPAHAELSRAITRAAFDGALRVAGNQDDIREIGMKINGWINVNPPGAHNVPHDHPGSFWSGAYYVKNSKSLDEPQLGGAISFIDARTAPTGQPLIKAPTLAGLKTFHPTAGTLLLFPSTIKHLVHPNDSDEDRVTIAFNVFVIPPAGAALPGS